MYFAVQGLFEGVAAGVATGLILTALKDNDVIWLLPIIVATCAVIAFGMTFALPKEIKFFGKQSCDPLIADAEAVPAAECAEGAQASEQE